MPLTRPLTEKERKRMDSLLTAMSRGSKLSKEWRRELEVLTVRYEAQLTPEQFKYIGRHR